MREAARAAIHDRLRALTGFAAPSALVLISRTKLSDMSGILTERLDLMRADGVAIRGLICRPAGRGPFPAILYPHPHGQAYEIGATELIAGRPALIDPPYAITLAARGLASLSIDLPCFSERGGESESAAVKRHLWQGNTLFGEMLADLSGALGISMGGTPVFWLGADDPLTPPEARETAIADIRAAYAAEAAQDRLDILVEAGTGHRETALMRAKALNFLSTAH